MLPRWFRSCPAAGCCQTPSPISDKTVVPSPKNQGSFTQRAVRQYTHRAEVFYDVSALLRVSVCPGSRRSSLPAFTVPLPSLLRQEQPRNTTRVIASPQGRAASLSARFKPLLSLRYPGRVAAPLTPTLPATLCCIYRRKRVIRRQRASLLWTPGTLRP